MKHLIFGDDDGRGHQEAGTGEIDLDQLKTALAAPEKSTQQTRQQQRAADRAEYERRRRKRMYQRRTVFVAVLVVLGLFAGLFWWYTSWQRQKNTVLDYAGAGDTEIIVQVRSGDGIEAIATTLRNQDVIASRDVFLDSASKDADIAKLKPGYYKVRQRASGQEAVNALANPDNRVGTLRLIPGGQLANLEAVSSSGRRTVPGYLAQIAEAACVPINGQRNCVTTEQLAEVARTVPAAELGVVAWAEAAVDEAPDKDRRLEGMILPGDYDLPPGVDAKTLLSAVVRASAAAWNQTSIASDAASVGMTPYQVAVVASIAEREGINADMPKVTRVIYNRLPINKPLQMDSTVNYALNRASIATSRADRNNPSPYNTYYSKGLPPTPISAPSPTAINAAIHPAAGSWLFFVKIDPKTNASCFSVTEDDHLKCVAQARANGVFN